MKLFLKIPLFSQVNRPIRTDLLIKMSSNKIRLETVKNTMALGLVLSSAMSLFDKKRKNNFEVVYGCLLGLKNTYFSLLFIVIFVCNKWAGAILHISNNILINNYMYTPSTSGCSFWVTVLKLRILTVFCGPIARVQWAGIALFSQNFFCSKVLRRKFFIFHSK